MATIYVNLDVQVVGAPPIDILPLKIEVGAYEKFERSIGKDSETKQDFSPPQPIDLGKNITFLLIKSSLDEPPNTDKPKLTYKIGDKEMVLDQPHIYMGKGSISTLGTQPLTLSLTFTPGDPPKDFVTIEILVGRDVP